MQEIVAIDFETTGSSEEAGNLPWQIGLVLLRNGKVCLADQFTSLLHVPADQPFNPYTPGRWATLRKELTEAPSLIELWQILATWFKGRVLLAHNVPVERGILQTFFPFHQFGPWLDSLVLARCAFLRQPSYKLEDLSANLGIRKQMEECLPDSSPHDALYDAIACAFLFQRILELPTWQHATLEQLAAMKAPRGKQTRFGNKP